MSSHFCNCGCMSYYLPPCATALMPPLASPTRSPPGAIQARMDALERIVEKLIDTIEKTNNTVLAQLERVS